MPLACLAGIFVLTAGLDECFLLLHIRGLVEHGRIGEGSFLHSSHSLATTGAYTVAASLLHWLGKGTLPVIRLLSPLSLIAIIFALLRFSDHSLGRRDPDRWIVAASLLLVHGTFMLGSQAYGEVLATALVFWGILLWTELAPGSWRRRLWVGIILGVAVATRINCAPVFVALGVTWACGRGDRRRELRDSLLTAGIGLLAFIVQWSLFLRFAHDSLSPSKWRNDFGGGNLLSVPLGYIVPKTLGAFAVGQDHLALVVVVGITAAWWCWARRRVTDSRAGDVLVVFGWLEGLAWCIRAPIPHLRYLWPSLAAFAAVGGLVLAAAFRAAVEVDSRVLRRGALTVALACVVSGYLEGSRIYLHGESDLLSWEYQRATPQTLQYGPFKYLLAQHAVVQHIRELPSQDGIATLDLDTALAFQTRRPILPILCYYREQASYYIPRPLGDQPRFPRWIVITPMVNRFPSSHYPAKLHEWMLRNCRLEANYGPYLLYEVLGSYPTSEDVFRLDQWEPAFPQVPNRPRG
jgi:hypothetical protein